MPEAECAVITEFVDNGFSGTNFERPAIQELLDLVRANKVDCIIVKDFSRFGRNSIETGYFIERVFPLFHTRFISVSDDFDSDRFKGDTGGMEVAFKYLINEYYSRDMSTKTRSAKYAKMERGEYQSKICPYGYRKGDDGRLEPDPEAAEVVRLIFQSFGEGHSAASIARTLTARKIPTPGEYKASKGCRTYDISRSHGVWLNSAVLRILEDERYTGTYVIGKRAVVEVGSSRVRRKDRAQWYIIPNHHPAIVDRDSFEAAQARLSKFNRQTAAVHEYPLKGKLFCGYCSHALTRTHHKSPYYICRHSLGIEGFACNNMKIPMFEVEGAVYETIKKQASLIFPDGIKPVPVPVDNYPDYERQISEMQEQKLRLYEQYVSHKLDLDSYRREKDVLDALILKTRNTLAAVEAQVKQAQERHEEMVQQKRIVQEINGTDGLTQKLADLLIDRVYVFPDKRIEIRYKIKDIFAV